MEITPHIPETVRFHTSDLLSKWGFGDGDMLNWLWEHHLDHHPRATLIECVRRRVLPELKQTVHVKEILCIHNPIRATTVNGENVEKYWHHPMLTLDPPLSPEWVEMSGAEVLKIAEEIRLGAPAN